MESDPIGLVGGINTYAYAGASPLAYVDPDGKLPQGFVNFSAGLGDALLLGFGKDIRDGLGLGDGGVDECSTEYQAGSWATFALGGLRLTYAVAAKGISLAASSGLAASEGRDSLKQAFRLGLGKGWRKPDLSGLSDAEIRAKAGRTNPGMNLYGAGVAAAGAKQGCGCPRWE